MSLQLSEHEGLRLAVEGCGHGTLHAIYASIDEACRQKAWPNVDLLIIGGDFQAVRNAHDLNCVSMPAKYRAMCDFHEYYSGARLAPCLTIFVGGNHEASNYLFELYNGGWVAPNIYYLGAANIVRVGDIRIAGLGGIWKGFDYRKSHFERLPYNESDLKSVYHVRELDVRKLLQVRTQVDIGISHDWPQGVEWKGDHRQLFRQKKHLEEDARTGKLGSVAAKQVLDRLRPRYWFSAHLHCKYAAVIKHGDDLASVETNGSVKTIKASDEIDLDEDIVGPEPTSNTKNDDEIDLDLEEEAPTVAASVRAAKADEIDLELEGETDGVATVAPGQGMDGVTIATDSTNPQHDDTVDLAAARAALPASFTRLAKPEPIEHPVEISNTATSFLALDKCLPNRDFLQLLAVPSNEDLNTQRPLKLSYDREWLAITRAFMLTEPPVFGSDPNDRPMPARSETEYKALITEQREWVDANLRDADLVIPDNFQITAPVYDGGDFRAPQYQTVLEYPNPQTEQFYALLQLPNPLQLTEQEREARMQAGPRPDGFRDHGGRRGRGGFDRGRGRGRDHRGRGRGGGGGGYRGWVRPGK